MSETVATPRARRAASGGRRGVEAWQTRQITATIAAGQSLSSAAVWGGGRPLRLFVPSGTQGAKLLLHASLNAASAVFGPSRGAGSGTYTTLDFAPGDCIELTGGSSWLDGLGALKLQTVDTDGITPVVQSAARVFTLAVSTGWGADEPGQRRPRRAPAGHTPDAEPGSDPVRQGSASLA